MIHNTFKKLVLLTLMGAFALPGFAFAYTLDDYGYEEPDYMDYTDVEGYYYQDYYQYGRYDAPISGYNFYRQDIEQYGSYDSLSNAYDYYGSDYARYGGFDHPGSGYGLYLSGFNQYRPY
jgi:hypothetical protein